MLQGGDFTNGDVCSCRFVIVWLFDNVCRVLVVRASTARPSRTRTSFCGTPPPGCCRWRTPARTRTARSSSSRLCRAPGWTASTSSSARCVCALYLPDATAVLSFLNECAVKLSFGPPGCDIFVRVCRCWAAWSWWRRSRRWATRTRALCAAPSPLRAAASCEACRPPSRPLWRRRQH